MRRPPRSPVRPSRAVVRRDGTPTLDQCTAEFTQGKEQIGEGYARQCLAIKAVIDHKLYKPDYTSLESYCQAELHISRAYAYRLADGAAIAGLIVAQGDSSNLTERVARALHPLLENPPLLLEAWSEIVSEHGIRPTSNQVKAVVAGYLESGEAEPEADVELDDADVVEEWTWAYLGDCARAELIEIARDNELDIDTDKAGDKSTYKLAKLRYDVARKLGVDVPKEDRPKRKSSEDTGTGRADYKSARVKKPGKRQDDEPERQPVDTSNPYEDDDYDDEPEPEPQEDDEPEEAPARSSRRDRPDADDWYEAVNEFLSGTNGVKRTFTFAKVEERDLMKFFKGLGFNKSDAEARIAQLRFDGALLDDGAFLYRRIS